MSHYALSSRSPIFVGWVIRIWLETVIAASWALTVALAVYAGTIVYGLAAGYALPSAAIFDLVPRARVLYRVSLYFPWALLVVAAIGALGGWIGALSPEVWQERERPLIRFWAYAGFPVMVLVFLVAISAGGWSGRFAPTEFNYVSTGGLVPYSDAKSYYGSAFWIGYWGHWDPYASRRPLAAALRDFTVLLGGASSYTRTLIVQAVLVAAATMFALRSVVAWCGIWVGIAFFAFVYGLARPFLATAMTEPLGLIWSLVSLAFFIEAIRKSSVGCALVGFTALTVALMTRMGSMFTIPFLMLWIPLAFASRWTTRFRIFAVTIAIALAILLASRLLADFYATPGVDLGGNVSDTLCGLAHGSNWQQCENLLRDQLAKAPSTHARNALVYGEAWRAFATDPTVALHKYWQNSWQYVMGIPEFFLEQYNKIGNLAGHHVNILVVLFLPGWLWAAIRGPRILLSFAGAFFLSTVLSAGVIFADDGTRAMEVTYAFMALLFAIGLSSPASLVQPLERSLLSWRSGAAAMTLALAALLVVPALQGAAVRAATNFRDPVSPDVPNISVVGGAPALTGFLVLPDGAPRPRDVPAFNATTFIAMYTSIYTPEIGPSAVNYLPQPPFAMVFGLPQNRGDYRWDFITPAEVLTDKTVRRWQFLIEPEKSPPQGLPFLLVSKVVPVE